VLLPYSTEQVGQEVTLCIAFEKYSFQTSARTSNILTESIPGSTWPLQLNSGVIPRLRHECFLANNFQLIIYLSYYQTVYTVAYLLKARTVEAEKQPLTGNGPYTRSKGTRHVRCDVTVNRRSDASGVFCGFAPRSLLRNCAPNTFLHQWINTVLSVGPARGYITSISHSWNWNWVYFRSW
jgi:hypothetical protein